MTHPRLASEGIITSGGTYIELNSMDPTFTPPSGSMSPRPTTRAQTAPLQEWIDELIEEMHSITENGKWVLIEDPALREVVGRHIGEVISELASCVRDPQAVLAGLRLRGDKHLPTSL